MPCRAVDSTKLAVCANPRISRNRTFKGLAARGRSTMGWFFGFKLHVVMNHKGELLFGRLLRNRLSGRG